MNDIDAKSRGVQAENLLADEMLRDALNHVRFAAHRAFERSDGDPAKLQRASDTLEAANAFHRYLVLAMKNGAAAAKRIDRDLQGGSVVRGIGRLVRSRRGSTSGAPWSEAG